MQDNKSLKEGEEKKEECFRCSFNTGKVCCKVEPKEESTPDQMPDFAKMSKEEFPDTKFPYVHIGFERGAERIWKEHYLPLKEEVYQLRNARRANELYSQQIEKEQTKVAELESELKNLREENNKLNEQLSYYAGLNQNQ